MSLSIQPRKNGTVRVFDDAAGVYLLNPVGEPRVFLDAETARRLLPELSAANSPARTQNARAGRLGVKAGR